MKITTQKQLVDELMRREGKKKQIDRAQMNEIVGVLADIVFEDWCAYCGSNIDSTIAKIVIADFAKYPPGFLDEALRLLGAKRYLKRARGKK